MMLLLTASCLFATTYFVSTTTGNDATGDGSQAKPWKTVRNAMLTVTSPGNTIYVMAGTYIESGSTLNLAVGVNLAGENVTTTIIKSALTGQWSTLLNLESNSLGNGNQRISGITFDGQYVSETNFKTWIGVWVTFRHNVVFDSCVFQNFYNRGLLINGNGRNESTIPTDPGIYATGIKIINSRFLNCGGNDGNTYGQLNIGGTKDALIQYNYMDQTQRPGIKNGECIKYWGSGYNPGLKIFDNTLKRANHYTNSYNGNGDWNFVIELFNNTGLEIARNTLQGSIDINYNRVVAPYTYSFWVHDNISDHTPVNNKEEQGMVIEFEANQFIIENNKFLNQSTGITFNVRPPGTTGGYANPKPTGGYSAITNGIIRNNLFTLYNLGDGICCSRQGIQWYVEGETKTAYGRNIEISNNTFVNTTLPQFNCLDFEYFGVQSNNTPAISGLTVKNNIFVGFTSQYLFGGSSMANVSVTNNCVWNCGNNNNAAWNGTTFPESNLKVNPALDANYLVTESSPLFGQGIGYKSTGTPPPPTPCVFTYGSWTVCGANGQQTRSYAASPAGCTGTPPADSLTRSCTPPPVPCTYAYSAWGPCVNGTQTRTIVSALPAGCTGTPVLSQSCVVIPPADTTFCSIIVHLPASGNIATKRNLTYFVKRSDGKYYDNTGAALDVIFYKRGDKWYSLFDK